MLSKIFGEKMWMCAGCNGIWCYQVYLPNCLSYLSGHGQGRKKPRCDCQGQVNFDLGQVKVQVWWSSGQVKLAPVLQWICLKVSAWQMIISREELLQGWTQCGQLSRIMWETPEFGPYLLVSRLESDISQIIAKGAISCRLDFPTIKFEIFFIVWATVNMEHFLINYGMLL